MGSCLVVDVDVRCSRTGNDIDFSCCLPPSGRVALSWRGYKGLVKINQQEEPTVPHHHPLLGFAKLWWTMVG